MRGGENLFLATIEQRTATLSRNNDLFGSSALRYYQRYYQARRFWAASVL